MELSFCEVCGKKIPSGHKFCDKHQGHEEVEKEFEEDTDEVTDEVFGII